MELNKKVIIRADRAGVFYGTIIRKDGDEVELKDCRRIWYWNGAQVFQSWLCQELNGMVISSL